MYPGVVKVRGGVKQFLFADYVEHHKLGDRFFILYFTIPQEGFEVKRVDRRAFYIVILSSFMLKFEGWIDNTNPR